MDYELRIMFFFVSLQRFIDMSNNYFTFKRFTVRQERCAMKVGTDGCLLGAWARGGRRVLDVGTGTGVVALMMAQRFPDATVTALDIDADAVSQARQNVADSPFHAQISIHEADFLTFYDAEPYEAIVSNPPFFVQSLPSPDEQRTLARHTTSLTYETLMKQSFRLLADNGELSIIIPSDCRSRMEEAAAFAGFQLSRVCAVKTTPAKLPRRFLLAFRKHLVTPPDQSELVIGSSQFIQLLQDFYIKF